MESKKIKGKNNYLYDSLNEFHEYGVNVPVRNNWRDGEEDEWVFNVLTVAGLSLRFVGSILGVPKTTLARRRDSIYRKLMNDLETHPEVQKWLANRTRPTAP